MGADDRQHRREEFDSACNEYGAECASCMKLAHLDSGGLEFQAAVQAKGRAATRIAAAWLAMVAAGDPETKRQE